MVVAVIDVHGRRAGHAYVFRATLRSQPTHKDAAQRPFSNAQSESRSMASVEENAWLKRLLNAEPPFASSVVGATRDD